MIKITNEQKQRFADNDLLNLPASLIVGEFLKSLTIDQIKKLAEQHNASVVEWVSVGNEFNLPKGGFKVLLLSNNVLQHLIFTLDQEDGEYSKGNYFWNNAELNECPIVKPSDQWAYLLTPPK